MRWSNKLRWCRLLSEIGREQLKSAIFVKLFVLNICLAFVVLLTSSISHEISLSVMYDFCALGLQQ
jgi:hypothetical protein